MDFQFTMIDGKDSFHGIFSLRHVEMQFQRGFMFNRWPDWMWRCVPAPQGTSHPLGAALLKRQGAQNPRVEALVELAYRPYHATSPWDLAVHTAPWKSSEALYTAPAGIGRGQAAPTGSYRVKAMAGTAHTVGGTLISRLLRVVSEEPHPNPFKAP